MYKKHFRVGFVLILFLLFLGIFVKESLGKTSNSSQIDDVSLRKIDSELIGAEGETSVIMEFSKKPANYRELIKSAGGEIVGEYNIIDAVAVKIDGKDIGKLAKFDNLIKVHKDSKVNALLHDSAPLISADKVWNQGITGNNVKVCIIDTGIDYTNPAIEPNCNPKIINGNGESYVLESPHNYPNNYNNTSTITMPGYTSIAVHFTRISTESGYDRIYIKDTQDNTIETLEGGILDKWSKSVTGDTIKINLVSDSSVTDYGFYIDQVLNGSVSYDWSNCNKIIARYDFVGNDEDPFDDNGHGTHVAGIIASDDSYYRGIANGSKLLIAKVLGSGGSGSISGVIKGIDWCINNSAQVISMSLGGGGYSGTCDDDLLAMAVNNAVDKGAIVVVAAGNSGKNGVTTPACASKALAVGAADKNRNVIGWSSRGPELDIVAPGVDITSTVPTGDCKFCNINGFTSLNGTSMATPHVTGVIALMLAAKPTASNDDIRKYLLQSADPVNKCYDCLWDNGVYPPQCVVPYGTEIECSKNVIGAGIVNASRAVEMITNVHTTPPIISILSPQNATYYSNSTALTFTIDEPTSWIGYSLDGGANRTITGNTIINGLSNSTHNVIVYAKDAYGITGSSNKIYFTNRIGAYNPWETSYIGQGGYPIIDIEQYNGKLYFASNNNNIYVFDNNSWSMIQAPTSVLSIQNYTDGKMYVTGSGGNIYSFDGSNFTQVFSTNSQYAKMLGVYNNKLYAGTYLANPAKLYYYDGSSWQQDTSFASILNCSAPFCSIDSMAVNGAKMYVSSGGTIYRYDGSWSILKQYDDVYAFQDMKVFNNKLYLATRDQSTRCPMYAGGSGFCGRVIEYDGTNWNTVFDHIGNDGYWMYSLEVYNGRLYTGTANKIYMTSDGTNWQLTFNSLESAQYVLALKTWNNKIYVGFGNGVMFKDDMLEPTIVTITSPQNIAYTKTYVPLTYTVSKPTSWLAYSLDGAANVTITGPVNLTTIANGQRNIRVYAKDTTGKTTFSSASFFYCLADTNGDKKIDSADVSLVQGLFGKSCGMTGYNASADINDDCKINLVDYFTVARQYGKTC